MLLDSKLSRRRLAQPTQLVRCTTPFSVLKWYRAVGNRADWCDDGHQGGADNGNKSEALD